MDTFMDKLAQKLTAQEIIKANATAETEELNQMRSQMKEYRACMQQLQEVGQGLLRDQKQLESILNDTVAPQVEKLVLDGVEKLDGAKVDGAEINRLVQESIVKVQELQRDPQELDEIKQKLEQLEDLKTWLEERIANLDESVHKECVKVYRNVQAVVVEENAKQTEEIKKQLQTWKGKLGAILGVSIAALVIGIGSLAFQLVVYLGLF